ncbi:MAG: SARP family transcriptional regulator, partial [Gemmatimonadales bacterium]|nr:SARP family transcriptional regulator [Gemmatimonadales bacterium]
MLYLALARPRGFHRRDLIICQLWPEMDDERGRAGLRRALHFLRSALGREVVVGRGDEEIAIGPDVLACDAWEFERSLDAGQLEAALDLYAGDLLPGFHLSDVPEWERWLDDERVR